MDLEESRIPVQRVGGTAEQQERLVEGCRAHWRLEVFQEEGPEEYRTFLFESWKYVVDKTEAASFGKRQEKGGMFSCRFATTKHFLYSKPCYY